MLLGKLPVPGRPTIWIIVGQGPTVLAVGAGWGLFGIFTLIYPFSPISPSLWETARYRLKYCLKGSLNPNQPTNQLSLSDDNQSKVIEAFNSTTRFLDDELNIVNHIHPSEFQLSKANVSDTETSFLDLHLSISDGFF